MRKKSVYFINKVTNINYRCHNKVILFLDDISTHTHLKKLLKFDLKRHMSGFGPQQWNMGQFHFDILIISFEPHFAILV